MSKRTNGLYLTLVFSLISLQLIAQKDTIGTFDGASDTVYFSKQHLVIRNEIENVRSKTDTLIGMIAKQGSITTNSVFEKLIAPILVGMAIAFFTWLLTRKSVRLEEANKFSAKIDAAPRKYVHELDKLIRRGVLEGLDNAVINARAIVSTRNSLRNSLIGISSQLNSDIDTLAINLGQIIPAIKEPSINTNGNNDIDALAAYNTILVLERTWDAKKEQIEVELRKLLAELGLSPA